MSNHIADANKMVGEDHIRDATKMVSDTPRTEAEVNRQKCWSDDLVTIDANFACQLERELNAANDRIKRLEEESESRWLLAQSAVESCAEMSSRIKRLEEAGDAVAAIIGPPGSAHWADENQVDAAWNNWLKAKEAKP